MTLKKSKAWKEFSKFIRNRDDGKCYTCFRKYDPREMDAGHRYHRSAIMFFDERFVRCQCTFCNRFRHGNLGTYERRLIEELGLKACQKAEKKSHEIKNWKSHELKEIYQKYKNLNMSKEIQVDEKELKVKVKKQCIHKGIAGVSCFLASCGYKKPKKKFDKS